MASKWLPNGPVNVNTCIGMNPAAAHLHDCPLACSRRAAHLMLERVFRPEHAHHGHDGADGAVAALHPRFTIFSDGLLWFVRIRFLLYKISPGLNSFMVKVPRWFYMAPTIRMSLIRPKKKQTPWSLQKIGLRCCIFVAS